MHPDSKSPKLPNLPHLFLSKNKEANQLHVFVMTPLIPGTWLRQVGEIWEDDETTLFLEVVEASDSLLSFDFRRVDIDLEHYLGAEVLNVVVESAFGVNTSCTTVPIAAAVVDGPAAGVFAPGAVYASPFSLEQSGHSLVSSQLIPLVRSDWEYTWSGLPICTKRKGHSSIHITAFSKYNGVELNDLRWQLHHSQPLESEQTEPHHVIQILTTLESESITAQLPVFS